MAEVFAILVAVTALVVGLLVEGWAFGDFQRQKTNIPPQGSAPSA